MSILIQRDAGSDTEFISKVKQKLNIQNEVYTNAPIIKQISPSLILSSHSKLLPKLKINNEQQLQSINLQHLAAKENVETIDKIDEKIIQMENEVSIKEKVEDIEIKKRDEDEDGQRRVIAFDEENLLKGFRFAFDPFGNCIEEEKEEEDEEDNHFDLKYKKIDERLKEIFG